MLNQNLCWVVLQKKNKDINGTTPDFTVDKNHGESFLGNTPIGLIVPRPSLDVTLPRKHNAAASSYVQFKQNKSCTRLPIQHIFVELFIVIQCPSYHEEKNKNIQPTQICWVYKAFLKMRVPQQNHPFCIIEVSHYKKKDMVGYRISGNPPYEQCSKSPI